MKLSGDVVHDFERSGCAIATAFAREGAQVFASDIDAHKLAELDRFGIRTAVMDVTDGDAIHDYAREVGPFDILVNCAGWVHHGTILDADEEAWNRSFEINLHSMFRTIRAVLPGMRERGAGTIVNIASVVSSISLQERPPSREGPSCYSCLDPARSSPLIYVSRAVNLFVDERAGSRRSARIAAGQRCYSAASLLMAKACW